MGDTEASCIMKLGQVLSDQVSLSLFSLNGFQDNAVCLEKQDGSYAVYNVLNGEVKFFNSYDNVVDACYEVYDRLRYCFDETVELNIEEFRTIPVVI